jgi:hypothetical protein
VLRIYAACRFTPNLNNEGFSIGPAAQCSGNTKPWIDDGKTPARSGSVSCTAFDTRSRAFETSLLSPDQCDAGMIPSVSL